MEAREFERYKRIADIVLASGALIVTFPLLAGGAAVCALSGEGILFWQERIGREGKPFRICKLRTMKRDTPTLARGELLCPEDYYIPGGAFLRSTGIDELPQLWNVLKGEMSLIGPRPLIPRERETHRRRQRLGVYAIRPGITGLAQLCGDPPPKSKAALDRLYLENRSPNMDGAIVLATLALLYGREREKVKIAVSKISDFLRNF